MSASLRAALWGGLLFVLAGCGEWKPLPGGSSGFEELQRSAQAYEAHNRAVARQERLKQEWIAKGRPPPLKGDRQ
jgi:hypothetical protein